MRLLEETKSTVTARILMPASLESEKTKKNKFDENQRIIVRYFLDSSRTRLSKLVVDEKFSLVLELKDDTKDNSPEPIRLATYSNNKSTVWTHTSIFETLWIQSESYQINRTNSKTIN
jgi:hypothetical protein